MRKGAQSWCIARFNKTGWKLPSSLATSVMSYWLASVFVVVSVPVPLAMLVVPTVRGVPAAMFVVPTAGTVVGAVTRAVIVAIPNIAVAAIVIAVSITVAPVATTVIAVMVAVAPAMIVPVYLRELSSVLGRNVNRIVELRRGARFVGNGVLRGGA